MGPGDLQRDRDGWGADGLVEMGLGDMRDEALDYTLKGREKKAYDNK